MLRRSFSLNCQIAVAGLLLVLAAAPPGAGQTKEASYRLALVMERCGDQRLDSEVYEASVEAFVASRRFTIIERGSLLSKESESLPEIAPLDLLGLVAFYLEAKPWSGTVPIFTIGVRLVDVKTGKVVATQTSEVPGSLPRTPREAGRQLREDIRRAFPLSGYVIKLVGADVVVDLGSEHGLMNGDALEVLREGEGVIHPITGEVLPGVPKVIGELKVVSISPRLSICRLRGSDGASPPGSMVRLKARSFPFERSEGKDLTLSTGNPD